MDALHDKLAALFKVIMEEARSNREFAEKLDRAVGECIRPPTRREARPKNTGSRTPPRGRNRRAKAVLDPFELFRSGEGQLRSALQQLNLEQLKDVVAEYGMDRSRLALRWKSPERLADLVVDTVKTRARKGDAFRSDLSTAGVNDAQDSVETAAPASSTAQAHEDDSNSDPQTQT